MLTPNERREQDREREARFNDTAPSWGDVERAMARRDSQKAASKQSLPGLIFALAFWHMFWAVTVAGLWVLLPFWAAALLTATAISGYYITITLILSRLVGGYLDRTSAVRQPAGDSFKGGGALKGDSVLPVMVRDLPPPSFRQPVMMSRPCPRHRRPDPDCEECRFKDERDDENPFSFGVDPRDDGYSG